MDWMPNKGIALDEEQAEKTQVCDDVDAELLPVFIEEADDLCPKIGEALRVWQDKPDDERQSRLLKRLLHTLKGSARMTGAMRIGELVHEMEDHVLAAEQSQDRGEYRRVLQSHFDRIAGLREELRSGEAGATETAQAQGDRRADENSSENGRMLPFASIAERLYRIVRRTAKELGKRVNLELLGAELGLVRGVLERMTAPLEHLLRNAIVHGLENDRERALSGKEPIGEIRLSLRRENDEVVIEFSDDGAGLNYRALREQAIAKGLLEPREAVSDEQLAQLIFMPGITTAAEVTEVAGRGIGMDVVRSEIAGLGGRIEVSSLPGHGTQFIIHLPLAMAAPGLPGIKNNRISAAGDE